MPGHLVNALPKRTFDFAGLGSSGTQNIIVAQRIDISKYIEAVLVVRVHGGDLTGGTVYVVAANDGHTPEEPGAQFLPSNPELLSFYVVPKVVLDSSVPVPSVTAAGIRVFGEKYVTVVVVGQRINGSPMNVTLSGDLILRSPPNDSMRTTGDLPRRNPPRSGGASIEHAQESLRPLFARWGLDVRHVKLQRGTLDPRIISQTLSDNSIVVSHDFIQRASAHDITVTLAHEFTHIVQMRRLGFPQAARRALQEERTLGSRGSREVPQELARMSLAQIDPADPRFPLEALATRVGDIVRGAVGSVGTTNSMREPASRNPRAGRSRGSVGGDTCCWSCTKGESDCSNRGSRLGPMASPRFRMGNRRYGKLPGQS